ncbi:MAG: exo-beta-N-acetylmuramidase NamZ domain-containing protein [Pyrinomonadaceae bacterium]
MFERYTEQARRTIFFARYEASQFGAPSIEPEHILLGILREDKPLFAHLLPTADALPELLRQAIEQRSAQRAKISTSVELPLAPEAKRVLAYAHEESDRLGHRHIGTEHMLMGILREERSVAADMLSRQGLALSALRAELSENAAAGPARSTQSGAETLSAPLEGGGVAHGRTGRRTVLGLEKLLSERLDLVRGARVGLVCNQASVNHNLQHAADLFHAQSVCKLTALFGPQHGIRGDVQDNMIETPHAFDAETGVPVYSLYSETREPTEEMLRDVDVLVFDLQDVGCRIYTFIYTLANCMRAAARHGQKVIVCDRPNPIGGLQVAGTVLEPEYASFVGQFPLATRHGLTVGELAGLFQHEYRLNCELEVVLMDGWAREFWFDETDAPWVLPSPNMPTLASATVFPGTVHLEGTQMSEGRGTTRPFELIGAPYIEASRYARALSAYGLPGVFFRPCNFQPTFQKHAGRTCGGVQIHVTDRAQFEPVATGVAAVRSAYELYPERFLWKEPPYEYVYDKNPFDVIAGTGHLRTSIERGALFEEIVASWREPLQEFEAVRARYLRY